MGVRRLAACAIAFNLVVNGAGAATVLPYPADEDAAARAVVSQAASSLEKYRLAPGDVVEVLFHDTGGATSGGYEIAVGDELQIELAYHPEFNRGVIVRSDGRITLPRLPDIAAFGRTPAGLAEEIVAGYATILRGPVVNVTVKKSRSPLAELKDAIDPFARGQSKRAIVSPDGRIALPLLPTIASAGRPLDEVVAEVNRSYALRFPTLRVSLLLESVAPNRVFVFGEVKAPGAVQMAGPMTVLQAVAMAGGALETGTLSEVRVLDWNEAKEPRVRTVNLEKRADDTSTSVDMWLAPNASVYLPPTAIARFGRAIDQVVRRIFLFNGFNIGVSYELRKNTQ